MAVLNIHLFGEPQIFRDRTLVDIPRRKSRMLAFYLAAHPGSVSRGRLLSLFWPDHERAAAQQSLRTTLHGLRRALGPELAGTDQDLAITPFAAVDARHLTAALTEPASEAKLAEALLFYRGPFLAGVELSENPEIEDWISVERERYQRIAIRGFKQLANLRSNRLDYVLALESLSQAATLDPLNEAIQRDAMLIEYRSGARAAAIRRYERLSDLLDNQLGVPPLAETRAIYDAIITDNLRAEESRAGLLPPMSLRSVSVPTSESEQLPFVGREQELERLQSLLHGPQLILIEGEPGIGKSHLAAQFIQQSGALGLVGTARELEQSLPYHPVVEALRSLMTQIDWQQLNLAPVWRGEIARLLPEIGPEGRPLTAADESRVWEAVSQLLQSTARTSPLILFLDDIQWADKATLGLLGYLARRVMVAPLTLVVATRVPEPRTPLAIFIQALTREGWLARMPLARLSSAATQSLARAVSPHFYQPLADWLDQASEGNPYFAVELLRYLREHSLLGPTGTLLPGMEQAGLVVPQTIESLILSRLARLSDPARLLLDIAVAAGREFAFELVAHASGLSEATILDALDELRAAHLVGPVADGHWRFDHSLTMEVAYREIGEPRHRQLHRRLADAIEVLYSGQIEQIAGTLAWHLMEAGLAERSSPYALIAARQAAALAAWQEAIALYQQALASRTILERGIVLIELGDVMQHVGHHGVIDVYQEAIVYARAHGNRPGLDGARLALAQVFVTQARYAEALAIAQQIRASGHPGSAVRAEMLWGVALSVEGADLQQASEHLQIAERLNDAEADPATHAQIIFELGSIHAQQGDLGVAIEYYQRALSYAEREPGAIYFRILAMNNLAYHMHLLKDPQAEQFVAAGLRLAQVTGMLGLEPFLRSTAGEVALAAGDLTNAEREFEAALAVAERLRMPERIAGLTANLGLVAQRQGQISLAVHRLSSAQAQADALGIPHLAAQIRIWLTPLLPPEQARATVAAARAIAQSSGRQRLLDEIIRIEEQI